MRCCLLLVAAVLPAFADLPAPCAAPATFTPCDLVMELNDADLAQHPNLYASAEVHAEFRSPRHRTLMLPAFWDGGRRLVIRFSPTEPGEWTYRITSNIRRFDDQESKLTATDSQRPGFLRPANARHWAYTTGNTPHLWMGSTCYSLLTLDEPDFRKVVDARAAQKFNHLRFYLFDSTTLGQDGTPDITHFRRADERIRYLNSKNLTADLIINFPDSTLSKFSQDQERRLLTYLISRFSAFDVTWELLRTFEFPQGRETIRRMGQLFKDSDPYAHPRTAGTSTTSSPLLPDGWMTFVNTNSSDDQLGAVEHQFFAAPVVNTGFALEGSDAKAFRSRLWNATMDGQYLTLANSSTIGGPRRAVDLSQLDSPGAKLMTLWYELFADTRHWELEPYFDVDGGRAIALEGVEYIIYVEKPSQPVEVTVERHGYDVAWIDPATGVRVTEKKFKGEQFVDEAPNREHDWVLQISREGKKEGMLRSYKFESRPSPIQEIEQNSPRVPFAISAPAGDQISLANPPRFGLKITRQTRAARRLMVLWTAEVVSDGQGSRVIGTGLNGTFQIPPDIALKLPAVLSVRVSAINANGKAYAVDKVYQLNP
jgi:hypothetical protein